MTSLRERLADYTERGSISVWLATASVVMVILVGVVVDLAGQVHAQQPGGRVEAHLGLDVLMRRAGIECINQHAVALGDGATPHLARARELAVVRV